MSKNYIIGFPRIGEQRELKKVLELFWAKKCSFSEVEEVASELKKRVMHLKVVDKKVTV